MRMNQPSTTQATRLEGRITVKRVEISLCPAEIVNMTRKVCVIEIQREQAAELIQAGDFLELEVVLPLLYGVPQRYLYCRCHVDDAQSCENKTIRFALSVENMQFRSRNANMRPPDVNLLVM